MKAEEIKTFVHDAPLEGFTAFQIEKEMRTSHRVVRALLDNDLLIRKSFTNPKNRCPVEMIATEDFERFQNEYVMLFTLATECGITRPALKKLLDDNGILPALDKQIYGATFYRRDALFAINHL